MRPDTYGRIAERAQTQLGLITIRQLDQIGVTAAQRRWMRTSGRWERRARLVDRLRTTRDLDYDEMALVAAELCRRGKPGSAAPRLEGRPDHLAHAARRAREGRGADPSLFVR